MLLLHWLVLAPRDFKVIELAEILVMGGKTLFQEGWFNHVSQQDVALGMFSCARKGIESSQVVSHPVQAIRKVLQWGCRTNRWDLFLDR